MKNLFVPYYVAVEAMEHGFDEECLRFYNRTEVLRPSINRDGDNNSYLTGVVDSDFVAAPTYGQLADWFRREKKLEITVHTESNVNEIIGFYFTLYAPMSWPVLRISLPGPSLDYYECWEEAFANAFSMIKPSKLKKT